jgi:hypothetical protein
VRERKDTWCRTEAQRKKRRIKIGYVKKESVRDGRRKIAVGTKKRKARKRDRDRERERGGERERE